MIYKRKITKKIKIIDLFQKLEINENENENQLLPFNLYIKTPYGYNKIVNAFRTEYQNSVTTYFKNNKTLKTSEHHLLKCNGEWKKIKDITVDDVIETETGTTSIIRKHINKKEILYDLSVDVVHCYYSNGILSHNSWSLVNFGAEALKQGKNVLHFTMELSANYTGHRYDSYLSGIPFQELKQNKNKIKSILDDYKSKGMGTLYVKYFPLKTATADTLKSFTEHLQIVTGIHIDMWIIDYVDLLLSSSAPKGSKSYEDAGAKSEEVRSQLGTMQIAGWSVSQANRCLSLQTIVNEELKGNIKIKNIKIGDKILTHTGYKKVSYIYPVKRQPVYKITLKSGKTIECSDNHRFPTQYGKLKSIVSGLSTGDKLFTKK